MICNYPFSVLAVIAAVQQNGGFYPSACLYRPRAVERRTVRKGGDGSEERGEEKKLLETTNQTSRGFFVLLRVPKSNLCVYALSCSYPFISSSSHSSFFPFHFLVAIFHTEGLSPVRPAVRKKCIIPSWRGNSDIIRLNLAYRSVRE